MLAGCDPFQVWVARHLLRDGVSYAEALKRAVELSDAECRAKTDPVIFRTEAELFRGTVCWQETVLEPTVRFTNRIFSDIFELDAASLDELEARYRQGTIPERHVRIIDELRTTYDPSIPVLVVTTDREEFVIYDGWHTVLACRLEHRPVSCLLGVAEQFRCFRR